MTLKAPVGLHINWPNMGVTRSRWVRRSKEEQLKRRDEALQKISEAFAEARAYLKAKEAESQKGVPYHNTDLRWEALKAVTLYPAQILGVADQVGSLEVGKDATLIVTDGDPLEIMTQVEGEFIQGRKIDLSSKHTQLYEKYKKKYEQLEMTNGTNGTK